jgi:hypothetical protein
MGGSKTPNEERMVEGQSGGQNLTVVSYLVWTWFRIYKTTSSKGYLEARIMFKFQFFYYN